MAFGTSNINLGNVTNAQTSGVTLAPPPAPAAASNYTGGKRGPNGEIAPDGYEYLPDGSLIRSASGGNQVTITPQTQQQGAGQAPAPPGFEYGPDGKLRQITIQGTDANGNPIPIAQSPTPTGQSVNSQGELVNRQFGNFPTD